ncbi:hypothetical protein PSHT_06016 [Puccinia striiformis]|uniref:Uncharacterized protein n=1 Tax=Puccinia striiformis TaxID=27350 RepID=A0A2S4W927_9BASI|nr:hypothetical protein PSHT_06016 [Puccinia striiformis]
MSKRAIQYQQAFLSLTPPSSFVVMTVIQLGPSQAELFSCNEPDKSLGFCLLPNIGGMKESGSGLKSKPSTDKVQLILAPLQHGGFDCNGARLDSFNGEEEDDGLETPGPKCCLPSLKPKKNENMAFEINAIDLPTDCTGPSSL